MRAALLLLALGAGCGSPGAYQCTSSEQCVRAGVQGVCGTAGYCAFPDGECPSGQRYEPNAAGGLGGQCVPDDQVPPDGPPAPDADENPDCGGLDQACCALEVGDPCGANLTCDSGTSTCVQCVTSIALGGLFSCALRADHTIWCAGLDYAGQLGDGSQSDLPDATLHQVRIAAPGNPVITDATVVDAGFGYACAVRGGGELWCWGDNNDGQLGDNTTNQRRTAVRVRREMDNMPLTGIVEIAAGDHSACARDDQGAVWCWGSNNAGQLATGDNIDHHLARLVAGLPPVTSINAGAQHYCTRTDTDEIWCWGYNGGGAIGNGNLNDALVPVHSFDGPSVSAGRFHTCAVKADTTVWCWGEGRHGRLGSGAFPNDNAGATPDPIQVEMDGQPFHAATVIAASVSCALTADKSLYCWGDNIYGQTGTGVGSRFPKRVLDGRGNPLENIDRVVAKFPHVCAFTTDGRVSCWGRNTWGELVDGSFDNIGYPINVEACR